jgi:hypothetical protein
MVWEKKRELKFSKDISNPAVGKKLSRILDDRAVVPLLTLDVRVHTFSLRSKDKQPLTLTIREFALPDMKKPLPAILELSSAKIGKNALKALAIASLDAAGIKTVPGDAAPEISAEATIKSAAITILKSELEILRYNEKGITADIDAECLHEFRVALRKTRVALDELNTVFPEDKIGAFMHKFDDLGAITNRLRDYDVSCAKTIF